MSKVKCKVEDVKTSGQVQNIISACMQQKLRNVRDTGISRNGPGHAIIWKEAAEENNKVWIPVWIIASSIFIS